jgi:proteasome lid subunit RPN8/RPN11
MEAPLYERFVATVRQRFPQKSFGYFISGIGPGRPTDFILLDENVRNAASWKPRFEAYGRYFVDHDDAGFVSTPDEAWRVQKRIWDRGMFEVGVFHSHQRHPANFSGIDYEMHRQRYDGPWHLIISLRNPLRPVVRVFAVSEAGVREIPLHLTAPLAGRPEAT